MIKTLWKTAIDPGLNMWTWKIGSLIPKSEWEGAIHVLATNDDPDHYWYTDRMVEFADIPAVYGNDLLKYFQKERLA